MNSNDTATSQGSKSPLLIHRKAATVARHADKDGAGRYSLGAVQIQDLGNGKSRISATDGRRAFMLEEKEPENPDHFPEIPGFDAKANGADSVLVSAKAFAAFVGKKPMRKSSKRIFECAAVTMEDRKATFAATDLEAGTVETIRTMDGAFPDIAADILPQGEPVFSIGVNPTYLAELCKSMAEIVGKDGAAVRLDFHGKDRAFTLTAETAEHKAIGVLMPVILD